MFFIVERSDGYIGVDCSDKFTPWHPYADGTGFRWEWNLLATFEEWEDAKAELERLRESAHVSC